MKKTINYIPAETEALCNIDQFTARLALHLARVKGKKDDTVSDWEAWHIWHERLGYIWEQTHNVKGLENATEKAAAVLDAIRETKGGDYSSILSEMNATEIFVGEWIERTKASLKQN